MVDWQEPDRGRHAHAAKADHKGSRRTEKPADTERAEQVLAMKFTRNR